VRVAVIGAGIVGCSAAAFLAEAGADTTVYERDRIAAAASGRNQGVLQHPMDDVLAPLYEESLRLHAETAPQLRLDRPPDGLLFVSRRPEAPAALAAALARRYHELAPTLVEDAARVEPALAPGLAACRLETGHQVPPRAATEAWAERARAAGARFELGRAVAPEELDANAVLVAAGPWSPVPVGAVWGVTVQIRLARPPVHALEEAEIEGISTLAGDLPSAFSAVTADGVTTVGSTFQAEEPDHAAVAPALLAQARGFLPGVATAELVGSRACARPVIADGRPLVGPLPGLDGVFVATGNGPWGLTCGPATARIAADAILEGAPVPAPLAAARIGLDSHSASPLDLKDGS
jgi:glycine/D-amino acid oxidase-like deaminating enzyme